MYVLFIFRRDLRINDNLALNKAISYAKENSCKLILAFTFTQTQTDKNEYFSNNCFQFMIQCLEDLNERIDKQLSFFENDKFYEKLKNIKAVCFNLDYTPYARKRDQEITEYCMSNDIKIITGEDYTLHMIESIKTLKGKPYRMFTPFYNNCQTIQGRIIPLSKTRRIDKDKLINVGTLNKLNKYSKNVNKKANVLGGREHALDILKQITSKTFDKYKKYRNCPSYPNSTTLLSAYLKFGCISIRETYYAIKDTYGLKCDLIKQLYWKDFYANITYHYPYVLQGMIKNENKSFNDKFDNIKWLFDQNKFDRWCKGKTGFPIVDAGMRQLNETGFMHNRLRMITASFLIKDLHIDWRKGEKYFATKLIDYDPASNNGGWQWVAGTGTDASPYYRIFNPWTQTERFDSKCEYIKKWVSELIQVDPEKIIKWYDEYKNYNNIGYYKPMVDHDIQKKYVKDLYKKINN